MSLQQQVQDVLVARLRGRYPGWATHTAYDGRVKWIAFYESSGIAEVSVYLRPDLVYARTAGYRDEALLDYAQPDLLDRLFEFCDRHLG